jgi:hypothetical protein
MTTPIVARAHPSALADHVPRPYLRNPVTTELRDGVDVGDVTTRP